MRKLRSARHSSQRGQGMTEYIIITALIAIGAIGAFVAFGDVVRGQVSDMASELGGGAGTGTETAAGVTKADGAAARGAKTLVDYHQSN